MPGRIDRSLRAALKQVPLTVAAGATAGTVAMPVGCQKVVAVLPSTNQDQAVKSVVVGATGITVTLAAAATAINAFTVTCALASSSASVRVSP